jgi:hypothetical protein
MFANSISIRALAIGLFLTGFAACLSPSQDEVQGQAVPHAHLPQVSPDAGDRAGHTEWRPFGGANSTIICSAPGYSRSARALEDPNRIQLKTVVVNPVTGTTERWTREFPASFKPSGAAGVTGNEFVVFGYGPAGNSIFEYWSLAPDPGTFFTQRDLPGTTVGTSAPLGKTVVSVVGRYTSPSKRDDDLPRMTRSGIYNGSAVDRVGCIAVDPEGRFILSASADTDRLYQIHINEDRAPSLLFDSTSVPALDGAWSISALRHRVDGLCWRIWGGAGFGYLWDYDNDGVIDKIESMGWDESNSKYPFGSFELPWAKGAGQGPLGEPAMAHCRKVVEPMGQVDSEAPASRARLAWAKHDSLPRGPNFFK